ncbi:MAG: DUF4835 family protein [Bacteroidetes bacterium]|nr:MAG: DUF4835 family protein [Bacteroidota bacterium]
MRRLLFFCFTALCCTQGLLAQEITAKVTVIATRISTQIDRRIFVTLQNQLTNLINNRKWTADNFKQNERIQCNFILNLDREIEKNVYGASLTVQAGRPLFNTSYNSPLVNWQDNDVAFRYVEYQPVEFNENRINGGTDGLASNLTAVFAYYLYIILGMDYNSFSLSGGDPYFKKALFVVNNAPEGRGISGWQQFDGLRNRWWLAENFVNTRFTLFHDAIYQYYRNSLDQFYEKELEARTAMLVVINLLNTFVESNPNTMMMQFFMQSKADELIEVFRAAPPDEKARARDILQKIDLTNANRYLSELK